MGFKHSLGQAVKISVSGEKGHVKARANTPTAAISI